VNDAGSNISSRRGKTRSSVKPEADLKALLRWQPPIIEYVIEAVLKNGIRDIVVVLLQEGAGNTSLNEVIFLLPS